MSVFLLGLFGCLCFVFKDHEDTFLKLLPKKAHDSYPEPPSHPGKKNEYILQTISPSTSQRLNIGSKLSHSKVGINQSRR